MSLDRRSRRLFVVVIAASCAISAARDAAAQVPAAVEPFEKLDINEDGVLSGTELKMVRQFDADGDGIVTKPEYAAGLDRMRAGAAADDDKQFAQLDGNQDGVLSGREKNGLDRYDADGDGELSKAEFLRGRQAERAAGGPDAAAQAQAAMEAAVRQRAEQLFPTLDTNGDGRLSGNEVAPEYEKFDTDGDRRITPAEFVIGMVAAARGSGNAPNVVPAVPMVPAAPAAPAAPAPGALPAAAWQKITVEGLGLSFQMPGTPKQTKEGPVTAYLVELAGGTIDYLVMISPIAPALQNNPEAVFRVLKESATAGGKVLDEDRAQINDRSGFALYYQQNDGLFVRVAAIIAGDKLVQAMVTNDPKTEVSVADYGTFFRSLEFGNAAGVAPAAPTEPATNRPPPIAPPMPAPRIVLTPPPSSGAPATPTEGKLIDFIGNLLTQNAAGARALMHPHLQAAVDRPILQAYFAIVRQELGEPQSKGNIDTKASDLAGQKVVQEEIVLTCANGPLTVTTKTADGVLIAFNMSAPQLQTLAVKMFEYLNAMDSAASLTFAKEYIPQCEKFWQTLMNRSADEAFALLDMRVQTAFRQNGEPAKMAKIRAEHGPISKIELVTFEVTGKEDRSLDGFQLGFELTREGKKPIEAEIDFKLDGLRALIIGYAVKEDVAKAADAEPQPVPQAAAANGPELAKAIAAEYLRALKAGDVDGLMRISATPWLADFQKVIKDEASLREHFETAVKNVSAPTDVPSEILQVLAFSTMRDKINNEAIRKMTDEVLTGEDLVVLIGKNGAVYNTNFVKITGGKAKVVGFAK